MQNDTNTKTKAAPAGCAYLKQKCKFNLNIKNQKIVNLYNEVTSVFLNEKKPIPEQSTSENSKIESIFLPLIDKFSQKQKKQFLCSKTFQNTEDKYFPGNHGSIIVFRCMDCGLQQNSICCVECFQIEKHKNHSYEMLDINGGCCDCGDDSKWDKKGFCQKHTIDELEEEELKDSQNEVQSEFLENFCNHCFLILSKMYQVYKSKRIDIKKLEVQQSEELLKEIQSQTLVADYILKIVDLFGFYFLQTLVTINKNRFEINKITRNWMDHTLDLIHNTKFIIKKPIKYLILTFIQLKMMGKACVELYLILFNRAEEWRRDITKEYFTLLSQIPTYIKSSFNDFSAQLFSSSKLILELLQNKEIKPLTYKNYIIDQMISLRQTHIKSLNDDFKRFLRDMSYLLENKYETFKVYWQQFSQIYGFQQLFNYQQVFNQNQENLRLAHKYSFFLEELALQQIIKIVDKMDGNREFMVLNLQKMTQKLQMKYEQKQIEKYQTNNLFFTYQRIWTIFLFAYFNCYKQKTDLFKSQPHSGRKQSYKQDIVDLLNDIYEFKQGAEDIEDKIHLFSRLLQNLAKQVLKRFYNMSQIMKSNQIIKQNMSFAMTYFKSSNILLSIDGYLLKFITKVQSQIKPVSISTSQSYSLRPNQSLIDEIDKYLTLYDDSLRSLMEKLQRYKPQQKKEIIREIQYQLLSFHNFLHIICQSLSFNYQELIILSRFKNLLKNDRYETEGRLNPNHKNNFISFYKIIHNIWCQKGRRDSLPDFKTTFQQIFFKEDEFFQEFINSFSTEEGENDYNNEQPINLQYFFTLRYKFNSSDFLNKFLRKVSFRTLPSYLKKQGSIHILTSSKHCEIVQSWLKLAIKNEQCHKYAITSIVKQLYKIQVLSWDKKYHEYFNSQFNKLYFQKKKGEYSEKPAIQKFAIYTFLNKDILDDVENHIENTIIRINGRKEDASYVSNNSQQIEIYQDYLEDYPEFNRRNENVQSKKKILSKPNTFDVNLGAQIERICMLGQECLQKNAHKNFYEVCFINITNMYGILEMDKNQKYLCFSTCGHLIHNKCYENQVKKNANKLLKCKKCKKTYNFRLSSLDYFLSQNQKEKIQLIQQDFKQINRFLSAKKNLKCIQHQIIKAIMVFLICNVTIDNFNYLRKSFLIYKNLFKKLLEVEKKDRFLNRIPIERNLKSMQSSDSLFIYFICERVNYEFNISYITNLEDINQKQSTSYSKQVTYINDIINCFRSQNKKWQIKQPSEYMLERQITKINLKDFPQSLANLNLKRNCWTCQSGLKHSYYICLYHNRNQIEDSQFCVCFECVHKWVRRHLQEEKDHMNECIMIRTDTGQIYYYYLQQDQKQTKLCSNIEDSVYLNKTMNFYEVGKKCKLQDFTLNQQKVKNIVNSLRSWNQVLNITTL